MQGTTPHKDPDGYFCFDGRKDDICNINGRKISAVRVEQAVLNLGIAEQAAVKPIEKNGRDYLGCMDHSKRKKSISRIAGNPPVVKKYFIRRRNPQVCLFSGCFSGK